MSRVLTALQVVVWVIECELIHYGAALMWAKAILQDIADAGYAAVTYHSLYQQAAEKVTPQPTAG